MKRTINTIEEQMDKVSWYMISYEIIYDRETEKQPKRYACTTCTSLNYPIIISQVYKEVFDYTYAKHYIGTCTHTYTSMH